MKQILIAFLLVISLPVLALDGYTRDYGKSQIVTADQAYPDFTQSDPIASPTQHPSKISIVIASDNKIKIDAIKHFFNHNPLFAEHKLNFIGIKTASNIAEQPIALKNGILGAKNRLKSVKSKYYKQKRAKADLVYFVAVENFFSEFKGSEHKPTDHALVIVEAPDGEEHTYLSVGVEINPTIYQRVVTSSNLQSDNTGAKTTIGEYLASKYHVNAADWFGLVTDHTLNREAQISSALKFAS